MFYSDGTRVIYADKMDTCDHCGEGIYAGCEYTVLDDKIFHLECVEEYAEENGLSLEDVEYREYPDEKTMREDRILEEAGL